MSPIIKRGRFDMGRKRKYTDEFKAKVALKAIRTLEIATQYEVHPSLIGQWKNQLLDNASSVFSKKQDSHVKEIEIEWVKKSWNPSVFCENRMRHTYKKSKNALDISTISNHYVNKEKL